MVFNNNILIVLGIVVGAFVLYKIFFGKNKFQEEYEQLYDKILTSDENKVKGQYDK
jgi:hypothetical protein